MIILHSALTVTKLWQVNDGQVILNFLTVGLQVGSLSVSSHQSSVRLTYAMVIKESVEEESLSPLSCEAGMDTAEFIRAVWLVGAYPARRNTSGRSDGYVGVGILGLKQ